MSRLAVFYYAVQPGVVTQLNEVERAATDLHWVLLAVEAKRPEEFETAWTANALGVTLPQPPLLRGDEVIQ